MRSRLIIKAFQWAAGIWLVIALALPVVKDVPAGHWASNHVRSAGVSGGSVISPRGDSVVTAEPSVRAVESHAGRDVDVAHVTCCTIPMMSHGAGTGSALEPKARLSNHLLSEVLPISRSIAPRPLPPRAV